MEEMVRLHNMVLHTKVLGPGVRTAIWFQGCRKQCVGCMSPSSRPLDGGRLVSVSAITQTVLERTDIEGITVSGGEPFLQIDALYSLLSCIRSNSDLGAIIYTGYTLDELKNMNHPKVNEIISGLADIIIDGEYIDTKNDGTALKGSSNQCVNFITERYKTQKSLYEQKRRDVEVVASAKEMFLIGIPASETFREWKEALANLQQRAQ